MCLLMSRSSKGASDSCESFQLQDDTTKKGVCLLELRHTGMVQWGVCRQVEPADEHGENNPQLPAATVKEELQEDEETASEQSLVLSELRKRKHIVPRQHGESRTKRYTLKRKTSMSSKRKQIKTENPTPANKENFKERWSLDRYKMAEKNMLEVMRAEKAVFENPISRSALRIAARKLIGDTGLLDHLLKHIDGKVAPGGSERFRRCYNTDGIMEYWLESADLVKVKQEGMPDPWWKPGNTVHRDSAASAELSMLKEEIAKLKRNMEEQVSKKEQDQANQIGEMYKEVVKWSGKTDQRLVEISNSLSSMQVEKLEISNSLSSMQNLYGELATWKSKTEKQLAEITNSLSNIQASRQCTNLSPTAERWEDWLENSNWDNIHGEDFGPWLESTDVANVRKEASMQEYTTTQPWLKTCDTPISDPVSARELGMLKEEMAKMKRDMQELVPKRVEEDQNNMTPDSSVTANSKLELDNSLLIQEMFKELVKWKAKIEQQILEISNSVSTLQASRRHIP